MYIYIYIYIYIHLFTIYIFLHQGDISQVTFLEATKSISEVTGLIRKSLVTYNPYQIY